MTWTELPGPSSFLDLVEQDLRESKSVLALVPNCFDDQWLYSIRSRLESNYEWMEVPNTVNGFYQEISCRPDGQAFVSVREIAENHISNRGFIVRNPPSESWCEWVTFLRGFAEFNRALDELGRNVFLVVSDELPTEIPNEPLISERRIEGFIRHEDSFFHAARTFESTNSTELWRRIRLQVCSELALWDFRLCDFLAGLTTNQLLDPFESLSEYGRREGWESIALNSNDGELRRMGLLFSVSGEEMHHSALLALQNRRDEILRRIWIAQVRVLFPVIEEQRLRLLVLLRKIQGATIAGWERDVGDDGELEIGILHHRMVTSNAFGRELTRLAGKLKNIRNSLAHLRICLPVDLPTEREWLQ
jgi:hypothetical protein